MIRNLMLGSAAAMTAVAAFPATATAQHYGYNDRYESRRAYEAQRRYEQQRYEQQRYGNYYGRRCSGTTGTILGAVAGGLLGREVAGRGDRTLGTIIGGAAGALAGRAVNKEICRR